MILLAPFGRGKQQLCVRLFKSVCSHHLVLCLPLNEEDHGGGAQRQGYALCLNGREHVAGVNRRSGKQLVLAPLLVLSITPLNYSYFNCSILIYRSVLRYQSEALELRMKL